MLGAITALMVARVQTAGEDPGRLFSRESSGGLTLNLLWLVVATAGAVWLARSRRLFRPGGAVALGLGGVTLLTLASTLMTPCYRNPATLIVWEWAVLGLIVALVRELAAPTVEGDRGASGLFAALMATAASVAAVAAYQALTPALGLMPFEFGYDLAAHIPPGSDFANPVSDTPAFTRTPWGSFSRPDTLACFLGLMFPGMAVVALRHRGWRAWTVRAVTAATGGVLVLAVGGALKDGFENRLVGGWTAAGHMIKERPWFGVGAGSFVRHAPRLQLPELPRVLTDAHAAFPELAATAGLLTAAIFILTLVGLFWKLSRPVPAAETTPGAGDDSGAIRWEFYLGGVAGLLIGLGLRLNDLPATDSRQAVFVVWVAAALRSLVWFMSFAVFEAIPVAFTVRRSALATGLAVVVLAGFGTSAMLRPAVAQPFWIVSALALAAPVTPGINARPIRWIAVPLTAVLTMVFALHPWEPTNRAASAMRSARAQQRRYMERLNIIEQFPDPLRPIPINEARAFLEKQIEGRLRRAIDADPTDASIYLELAAWLRVRYQLVPTVEGRTEAFERIEQAASIDPDNAAAPIEEIQTRLLYARYIQHQMTRVKSQPAASRSAGLGLAGGVAATLPSRNLIKDMTRVRNQQIGLAVKRIDEASDRDPPLVTRLWFRIAQALVLMDDPELRPLVREFATRARSLDQSARTPRGNLLPEQRDLIQQWLAKP
jgi:hypothetical protein